MPTPEKTRSRKKPENLRQAMPGARRILKHVRPHLAPERPLMIGGFAALLFEVGMRLLEPWPMKFVIDSVVAAGGSSAGQQPGGLSVQTVIGLSALALLVIVGLRALGAYLTTLCFALVGSRLLTRLRAEAFGHLQRLSLSFHATARTGDLVTRITSDVGRLREVAVTAALPLIGNLVTMIGMTLVVAWLDWQLALVMLSVVPIFMLTGRHNSRKINSVSKKQRSAEGQLASLATESLGAIRLVHSYSLASRLQQAFTSSNVKTLKDGVAAKKLSAGLERTTDVLVGIATALVLYIGALRVVDGALTVGELVVFLTYLKAALKPMRDLAKYTGRIAQASASGERLVDLLEEEPDVTDRPGARRARPLRGDIRFDEVDLTYGDGRQVLKRLNLHIPAGQRVALVGPSGAGKSSIASLLSRLRDPDQGRVLFDGQDLRDLTLQSVRSQVAVVLQESMLFATTVRENIEHGRPGASDQEIEQAARIAGAHDFVMSLPEGYDTVVGERGGTLSGGQRQRISIARAALRNAPIVVLDEAMSGLDEGTELEVAAALNRLTQGRTTIVITHDLSATADCDRVVWLQGGAVVDDGPPEVIVDLYRMSRRSESSEVELA
ncbi:ABC transporter ATP-binding protein [Kineosporia babensis]|uniref:ABC transporter ATP-binding protein/permease n=1 Tax=Kineosporia babensis TaxID=499548 RepID=A0A9X1SX81_9ACTN|nr:ABC transporter ATP-binding protein [Kineosporia babensis]MCD5314905.1 ABC transporter ATP-binding protein/permease [Kineosporia babensis]